IEGCTISENKKTGVLFSYDTSNNQICNSTISNNQMNGIEFRSNSHQNTIYHNNFINNSNQAVDKGYNNVWDDGTLGNYWSDYTGQDANNDCIGDTPYNISGGTNKDKFPLLLPYGEQPSVKIISPEESYIYFRNLKIYPFFTTLLFGNIKIKTNAANYIYGIERVEFYVDNILRRKDTTPPYDWVWRLSSHLKHRHIIKVIVYDNDGQTATDEMNVLRFF
ncbi:MAG: right-handed parallel beta-helix repeat-containing protein, partial [Thermoplasmata archaeon]|nr:right-handed parallel beta-helix repeat-containing protein [Thermoplasmata archaeon]